MRLEPSLLTHWPIWLRGCCFQWRKKGTGPCRSSFSRSGTNVCAPGRKQGQKRLCTSCLSEGPVVTPFQGLPTVGKELQTKTGMGSGWLFPVTVREPGGSPCRGVKDSPKCLFPGGLIKQSPAGPGKTLTPSALEGFSLRQCSLPRHTERELCILQNDPINPEMSFFF